MKNYWKELPIYGKWLAGVVAGLGAAGTIITGVVIGIGWFHTQAEADELEQRVYQFMADEKKADRMQRNRKDLAKLQRDLIGQRYTTQGEKSFIEGEIRRLQAVLLCDEAGICP